MENQRSNHDRARIRQAVLELPGGEQTLGKAMDLRAAWLVTFLQRLKQRDQALVEPGLAGLTPPAISL